MVVAEVAAKKGVFVWQKWSCAQLLAIHTQHNSVHLKLTVWSGWQSERRKRSEHRDSNWQGSDTSPNSNTWRVRPRPSCPACTCRRQSWAATPSPLQRKTAPTAVPGMCMPTMLAPAALSSAASCSFYLQVEQLVTARGVYEVPQKFAPKQQAVLRAWRNRFPRKNAKGALTQTWEFGF